MNRLTLSKFRYLGHEQAAPANSRSNPDHALRGQQHAVHQQGYRGFTVSKLLIDAGNACAAFHDKAVRGVPSKAVQCDEMWSFSYAKNKNVKFAKAAPEGAGDVWTWTAIDADSKLIVSWHVGDRSAHWRVIPARS